MHLAERQQNENAHQLSERHHIPSEQPQQWKGVPEWKYPEKCLVENLSEFIYQLTMFCIRKKNLVYWKIKKKLQMTRRKKNNFEMTEMPTYEFFGGRMKEEAGRIFRNWGG